MSTFLIFEILSTVIGVIAFGFLVVYLFRYKSIRPAIKKHGFYVPGKYLLVDHALARMNKGAWAVLEVTGNENPEIFSFVGGEGRPH